MATKIFSSSVSGAGVQASLVAGQDLFVTDNVTVGSEDSYAIDSVGSGHRAIVNGTIVGEYGMMLGDNTDSNSSQSLTVGANAAIYGMSGSGVEIFGYSSSVNNKGYIYGYNIGITIKGVSTATQSVLNNSGIIEGGVYGVSRYSSLATETLILKNTGTISGAYYSFYAEGASTVEQITNSGNMVGDVYLAGGADLYDGRKGHVEGTIFGGAGADTIYGGTEDNVINGGADADVMQGGKGNDTYTVDNIGDKVIEANETGIDEVLSSVTFSLAGQYIEKLTLTGADAINGTGNTLANTIDGYQNAAANVLTGGDGNDTYLVGANDIVKEASGSAAGTLDIVKFTGAAGETFSLAGQYVERLELLGAAATNGTGNTQANTIIGNAAANILAGGKGIDKLTGGLGADTFVFDTALSATTNIDTITDFTVVDDTIQLSADIFAGITATGVLSASAFHSSTSGTAHDGSDRIIYETDTGKLFYDSNGDVAGGAVQFALLDKNLALTAADFFVV